MQRAESKRSTFSNLGSGLNRMLIPVIIGHSQGFLGRVNAPEVRWILELWAYDAYDTDSVPVFRYRGILNSVPPWRYANTLELRVPVQTSR